MSVSLVIVSLVAVACICLANRLLQKRWGWVYSWTWKPEAYLCSAIRSLICACEYFSGSPSESEPVKSNENIDMLEDSIDDSCLAGSRNAPALNESDLEELIYYINETDGGSPWQPMMEKSTATMAYRAWYRDSQSGPVQYRTRTIFKNVLPEVVRDFFWDDEFRTKWDKMLVKHRTLHVCRKNGSMIVQWIRKLPVICSEREYIIVRRIWESQSRYYCVTKGTEYPSSPKHRTPWRVELYYSSYLISSAVEVGVDSQDHTEVLLFHYEDSGLPKEIVKMAARAGMWGLMRRMDTAVRSYSIARANGAPPSEYAFHAAVTTEFGPSMVPVDHLGLDNSEGLTKEEKKDKRKSRNIQRWLVVGGIVILSCLTMQAAARKRMSVSVAGRCCRGGFR